MSFFFYSWSLLLAVHEIAANKLEIVLPFEFLFSSRTFVRYIYILIVLPIDAYGMNT